MRQTALATARLGSEQDADDLIAQLELGDIICFVDQPFYNPIAIYQGSYAPPLLLQAVRTTHVGVYIGNKEIVHARPPPWTSIVLPYFGRRHPARVEPVKLWDFVSTYANPTVSVIRCSAVTPAEQHSIVTAAASQIGRAYDLRLLRNLMRQALVRRINLQGQGLTPESLKELICSRLVLRSYALALGTRSPFNDPTLRFGGTLLPAHIYMADGFDDVL